MAQEMDQTSWRGMTIDHPAEWELAVASGANQPTRCVFADRFYHRLDVRWRPLKYVPKLDRMLEKFRHKAGRNKKAEISPLSGAPPEWRGLVRQVGRGTFVHAGRFYKPQRLLVEVTMVWPGRRNTEMEKTILAGIGPEPTGAADRRWQAMGIRLTISREFELLTSAAQVGRVQWDFATSQKRGPQLTVQRIALPEYWLNSPMRDWLEEDLPDGWRQIRQDPFAVNGHRGEQLVSRMKIGPLAALRGRYRLRLDVAWLCPVERRVYRITFIETSRDEEIVLPKHVQVRCCRPVPAVANA